MQNPSKIPRKIFSGNFFRNHFVSGGNMFAATGGMAGGGLICCVHTLQEQV